MGTPLFIQPMGGKQEILLLTIDEGLNTILINNVLIPTLRTEQAQSAERCVRVKILGFVLFFKVINFGIINECCIFFVFHFRFLDF